MKNIIIFNSINFIISLENTVISSYLLRPSDIFLKWPQIPLTRLDVGKKPQEGQDHGSHRSLGLILMPYLIICFFELSVFSCLARFFCLWLRFSLTSCLSLITKHVKFMFKSRLNIIPSAFEVRGSELRIAIKFTFLCFNN